MSKSLKTGDRVEWQTSQGPAVGRVQEKLTAPITIKSHRVTASPDHPEYLVKSEKSGRPAAHKASALRKADKK